MRLRIKTVPTILGMTGIAALVVAAIPGTAAAAPTGSGGNHICAGTSASPGILAGNFANVTITGTCLADAGNVNISGNLIIAQNASLVADFGQNDRTNSGTSNLTVGGNMVVEKGGSTLLGCYPLSVTLWGGGSPPALFSTPDFPCDDEADPLNTPVLSATEYIGGNLIVTGMDTSWYGIIRNTVRGSVIDTGNTTAPDGNEVSDNTVYGNLVCSGNDPAVEYGDSNGSPSEVGGNATGECGFNVLIPNPSPISVPGLSSYPLEHVSVHLHR